MLKAQSVFKVLQGGEKPLELTIQILLSVITAVITGVVGWLFYKLRKYVEKKETAEQHRLEDIRNREIAINGALRALCHDRILQTYKDFRNSGVISAIDLEMTAHLYDAYHALGGNGAVTAIYNSIKKSLDVSSTNNSNKDIDILIKP